MNSYRRVPATLGNEFSNLYHSAHDLVDRFGMTQDMDAGWIKFGEEVTELYEALLTTEVDEIAEEAVDVIVTLINVLRPAGVSTNLFIEKMREVWQKNDQKDIGTHVVHNGLITRRSKLEGVNE